MEGLRTFSNACVDLQEQFEVLAATADTHLVLLARGGSGVPAAKPPAVRGGGAPRLPLPDIAARAHAAAESLGKLVGDTLGEARAVLGDAPGGGGGGAAPAAIVSASAASRLSSLCAEFATLVVAAGDHGVAPPHRAADGALVPAPVPPPPPQLRRAYFLDRATLFSSGPTGEVGGLDPLPPGHTASTWPHPPPAAYLLRCVQELGRRFEADPAFVEEHAAQVGALLSAAAEAPADPLATSVVAHRMLAAASATAASMTGGAFAGRAAASAAAASLSASGRLLLGGGAGGGSPVYSEATYAPGPPLPYCSFLALLQGEPAVAEALAGVAAVEEAEAAEGRGAPGGPPLPPPRVLVLGSGLGHVNFYVALTFGVRSLGLDVLHIMTASALALGSAAGVPAHLTEFRQGDAAAPASAGGAGATASSAAGGGGVPSGGLDLPTLAGARVVFLCSATWDAHLRRAVYARLLSAVPHGCVIVDTGAPVNPLGPGREMVIPLVDTVPGERSGALTPTGAAALTPRQQLQPSPRPATPGAAGEASPLSPRARAASGDSPAAPSPPPLSARELPAAPAPTPRSPLVPSASPGMGGSAVAVWPSATAPGGYELGPALASGRSTLPGARALVAEVAASLAASTAQANAALALIRSSSPTVSPLAALPAPVRLRKRFEHRSLQPVAVLAHPGLPRGGAGHAAAADPAPTEGAGALVAAGAPAGGPFSDDAGHASIPPALHVCRMAVRTVYEGGGSGSAPGSPVPGASPGCAGGGAPAESPRA